MDRAAWLEALRSDPTKNACFVLATPGVWASGTDEEKPLTSRRGSGLAALVLNPMGVPASHFDGWDNVTATGLMSELRDEFPASPRLEVIEHQKGRQQPNVYMLNRNLCESDLFQFEQELRQAETAMANRNSVGACGHALDAISYWQGGTNALRKLDSARFDADQQRLRVGLTLAFWICSRSALAIGRFELLCSELRGVVAELRSEPLWACFIWASVERSQPAERPRIVKDLLVAMQDNLSVGSQSVTATEIAPRLLGGNALPSQLGLLFNEHPDLDYKWTFDDGLGPTSLTNIVTPVEGVEHDPHVSPRKDANGESIIGERAQHGSEEPIDTRTLRVGSSSGVRVRVVVRILLVAVAVAGLIAAAQFALRPERAGPGTATTDGEPGGAVIDEVAGESIEAIARFDFDTADALDSWTLTAEDLDPVGADECYVSDPVAPLRLTAPAGQRGRSIEMAANPVAEVGVSEHLIAGSRLPLPLPDGLYRYETSAFIDSQYRESTQTGPEASVQITRDGVTTIAAFQAVPNPWVNTLQIWSVTDGGVPGWITLTEEYEGIFDEWVDVVLDFDVGAGTYIALTLDSVGMDAPTEFDLLSYRLPSDVRGFDDGTVLTVESENLWACGKDPLETWTTLVNYDDVALIEITGDP